MIKAYFCQLSHDNNAQSHSNSHKTDCLIGAYCISFQPSTSLFIARNLPINQTIIFIINNWKAHASFFDIYRQFQLIKEAVVAAYWSSYSFILLSIPIWSMSCLVIHSFVWNNVPMKLETWENTIKGNNFSSTSNLSSFLPQRQQTSTVQSQIIYLFLAGSFEGFFQSLLFLWCKRILSLCLLESSRAFPADGSKILLRKSICG